MHQKDPTFGETRNSRKEREALAAAMSLSVDDLDPNLPAQMVSRTGMPFCISGASFARGSLAPADLAAGLTALSRSHRSAATSTASRAAADSGADWHARMQFNGGEDPATGSASGCAIAYLVRHQERCASGQQIVIEQGVEILRPSRIHVSAAIEDGVVKKVFVGGRTIPVACGRFFLP